MTISKQQLQHISLAVSVIWLVLFLTVYFAAKAGAAVGALEVLEEQRRNKKGPKVFPLPRKS